MTPSVLRVACVGAGYFAKLHRDAWERIGRTQIVGVCDLDRERAAATGYPAFADSSAMLAAVSPDLLDVILPPAAQGSILAAAMDAGVPAIICQKPFCVSLAEAEEMASRAHRLGIRLIIHENFRFQPWYRAAKAVMDSGRIGEILQATFRLRPGDGQGPNAYLDRQPYFREMPRLLIHETGVHWIDTFRFLMGKPEAVYADLRRLNPVIAGEDAGYVIFDFHGGKRALFDGNRLLDHAADNLRRTMGEALIEGTLGTLTIDGSGSVRLRARGSAEGTTLVGPDRFEGFGGDCVRALQEHVVEGLLDGRPIENEAAEYLEVIRIEEAVYLSAREGRRVMLG